LDGKNRLVDATFAQADEWFVKDGETNENLNEDGPKKVDADQIQEDPDFNNPDKQKKLEAQLDQNTDGMLKPEKQKIKAGDRVEIPELQTSAEVLATSPTTIQVKLTNGNIVEYPADTDKIRTLKESGGADDQRDTYKKAFGKYPAKADNYNTKSYKELHKRAFGHDSDPNDTVSGRIWKENMAKKYGPNWKDRLPNWKKR